MRAIILARGAALRQGRTHLFTAKMAARTASLSSEKITLTVSFEGNRLTLTIPKNIKVYEVVQKAAEEFKVKPEGLGFLYQGLRVPEELTVEEALAAAGSVTVIHLIRVGAKGVGTKGANTTQVFVPGGKPIETLNAFCKDCSGFVAARVVFQCPHCKEEDKFHRSSAVPIDHFSGEISSEALRGSCAKCEKEDILPSVIYCCKMCDSKPVALLRQIRDNVLNVPCMKCTLKKEKVFKFTCDSQHCMCLDCFCNFCKQQLMVGRFQQFSDMDLGYSIACPGPGEDCKRAVIPDPHHFRIVDGDGVFYKKFTEMSFKEFQPVGDQVLCKCRHVIDMTRGKPVPVEPTPQVTVSGLRWYQRLFRTQPRNSPPPKPKTRRRASCTNCKVDHCLECKQLWHDGECQKSTKELEEQDKAFPIDPAKAREARWPPSK